MMNNDSSVFDADVEDTEQLYVARWRKEHVQRIRGKAVSAEGLGPFWRGVMLAALDAIDAERAVAGKMAGEAQTAYPHTVAKTTAPLSNTDESKNNIGTSDGGGENDR